MKNDIKNIISVTMVIGFSKILGVLREVILAYKYGTSYIADAYSFSMSYIDVFFSSIATGALISYTNTYTKIKCEKKRNIFFTNSVRVVFLLSFGIAILLFLNSSFITKLFVSNGDLKVISITNYFIKVLSFYFPPFIIFNVLCAHDDICGDFTFNRFCSSVLSNIVIIITIYISNYDTYMMIPYGCILSILIPFVLLFIRLIKKRMVLFTKNNEIKDCSTKSMIFNIIPLGLSYFLSQLNTFIDKIYSSGINVGIISSQNYAFRIKSLTNTFIISIIFAIFRPRITEYFANNDIQSVKEIIKKIVLISLSISLPISILLFMYPSGVVGLLLKRGSFLDESVLSTSSFLKYYSIGIPFFVISSIYVNSLNSNNKQRTTIVCSVISIIVNIFFNQLLLNKYSYSGLAIATSVSEICLFLALTHVIKRNKINIVDKDFVSYVIKMIIFSILSIAIVFLIENIIVKSVYLIVMFFVLYFVLMFVFNRSMFKELLAKGDKNVNKL